MTEETRPMPTVAVLMSTYNGEKYLQEQIESILAQRGVTVELYVRDDGSTDGTLNILNEYGPRTHRVEPYEGNLGPACSFMHLLYEVQGASPAAYFAFADQDDVWLEDKLLRAIEFLEGKEGPRLYCSNQIVKMPDGTEALRYSERIDLDPVSVLFSNKIAGCTMVFNKALAKKICAPEARPADDVLSMRMHDTWVLLAALVLGNAIYDPESRIIYRIHDENTVGVRNDDARFAKRIRTAISSLSSGNNIRYRSAYAEELVRCFPTMDSSIHDEIRKVAEYRNGFCNFFRLLTDKYIRVKSEETGAAYTIKVLLRTL